MSTDRIKDIRFIPKEDFSAGEFLITGYNSEGQQTLMDRAIIGPPIVTGHELRLLVPSKSKSIVQVTRDKVKNIMQLSNDEFMITMKKGARLHMVRALKKENPETINMNIQNGQTILGKIQNLFKGKS
jgi:hypothetical protein